MKNSEFSNFENSRNSNQSLVSHPNRSTKKSCNFFRSIQKTTEFNTLAIVNNSEFFILVKVLLLGWSKNVTWLFHWYHWVGNRTLSSIPVILKIFKFRIFHFRYSDTFGLICVDRKMLRDLLIDLIGWETELWSEFLKFSQFENSEFWSELCFPSKEVYKKVLHRFSINLKESRKNSEFLNVENSMNLIRVLFPIQWDLSKSNIFRSTQKYHFNENEIFWIYKFSEFEKFCSEFCFPPKDVYKIILIGTSFNFGPLYCDGLLNYGRMRTIIDHLLQPLD